MTTPPDIVAAPQMTKFPDRVEVVIPVAVDSDRVGTQDGTEIPATVRAEVVETGVFCAASAAAGSSKMAGKDVPQDIDHVRGRWKDFIKSLRGEGSSGNLDAFLRSACDPLELEDDTLVLGFRYPFHKEKIEDAKYRHLVEKKLKEVFGRPYKIRCTLVEAKTENPSRARTQNPVIKAALEMGAKIKEES